MRRDNLTLSEFGALFRRLCLGYQRAIPEAQLGPTIEVYFDAVRGYAAATVEQVVSDFLRSPVRYFPRAPDLAERCHQKVEGERIRRGGPHAGTMLPVCPACQTEYTWRHWFVTRRSARDERPTAVELELLDGTVVELVKAERNLCECGLRGALAPRTVDELRALGPDHQLAQTILRERGCHQPPLAVVP